MLRSEHEEIGRDAAGGFGRDLYRERGERAHAPSLRGRDVAIGNLRVVRGRVGPAPMQAPFARLSSLGRPKGPARYLETVLHPGGVFQ